MKRSLSDNASSNKPLISFLSYQSHLFRHSLKPVYVTTNFSPSFCPNLFSFKFLWSFVVKTSLSLFLSSKVKYLRNSPFFTILLGFLISFLCKSVDRLTRWWVLNSSLGIGLPIWSLPQTVSTQLTYKQNTLYSEPNPT